MWLSTQTIAQNTLYRSTARRLPQLLNPLQKDYHFITLQATISQNTTKWRKSTVSNLTASELCDHSHWPVNSFVSKPTIKASGDRKRTYLIFPHNFPVFTFTLTTQTHVVTAADQRATNTKQLLRVALPTLSTEDGGVFSGQRSCDVTYHKRKQCHAHK